MNYLESLKGIESELNEKYSGMQIVARNSKSGEFENARIFNFCFSDDEVSDLYMQVAFSDRNVTFNVNMATKAGSIKIDLSKYLEKINSLNETRKQELKEKRIKELEEEQNRREQERLAAEKKVLEERFSKRIDKQIKDLSKIKVSKNQSNNYYNFIGWCTKHLNKIYISMPDYLEKWFVGRFGDLTRTIIDRDAKTSGGFPKRYSLCMMASFNKELPEEYRTYVKPSKPGKNISNNQFIIGLIENFNFDVNKKQDINKIIKEIPTDKLGDFKEGYNK